MNRVVTARFRSPRRGFTVLELMTAVLIALIVGSVATAGFFIYEKQMPLDQTGRRLTYFFSLARSHAVGQNAPFAFQFDPENSIFWLDCVDDSGNITVPKVQRPEKIDEKVEVFSMYSGSTEIYASGDEDTLTTTFYSDGSCDDLRILIKLKGTDETVAENVHTIRLYGPTAQSKVFEHQIMIP